MTERVLPPPTSSDPWRGLPMAVLSVLSSTGVSWLLFGRSRLTDVVMIYLLGIVLVSMRGGYRASLLATVLAILSFDFVFVPPYFSFSVADFTHVVTFAVMFAVAVIISRLAQGTRDQAEAARRSADEAHRAQLSAETEKMRSSLLSSVSHDLRTPLGVITAATTSLLHDEGTLSPEARRDLLETANEEAERLNRLVRNLLDMTRVASTLQVKKEWHPVDELLGVALDRLGDRLGDREVGVLLAPDLPPVAVDAVLVEQVLINLLENAVKYSDVSTPIQLSAETRPGEMMVEVADRGPGVSPPEREKIFDKFYRATPGGGGAGLGLAICKGIVEAHGGRIWVESRPGGGASFRFTLPTGGDPPPGDAEGWSS